jgi:hypothetical protein
MTHRKNRIFRGTQCLNCNTSLDISEQFCHNCGQLNSTKKVDISDFLEEFFANFYAYDSKIRNTFRYIFTRPAFLVKEIIAGKRQSYANPFRLFLSIVLIYFLFNSFLSNDDLSALSNYKEELNSPATSKDILEKSTFQPEIELNKLNFFQKIAKKTNIYTDYITITKETSIDTAFSFLKHEKTKMNCFLYKKSWHIYDLHKNKMNSTIVKAIKEKMPFIIFVFLPFITIAFFIVFYTKDNNFTDHLLFVYTLASVLFIKYFLDLLIDSIFNLNIAIVTFILLFLIVLP